jgi:glycosyltransferase involved in cell wall biosynthesis
MSTPERLRVLWISHGGIGVSETFIAETVRSLQSMSELTAISGGSKASPEDARLGVQPMGFMSLRPSLARWLKKAALGGEPWIAAAQRRAARACRSLVQEMRPDVAWVDYATSAVFAKALLRDAGIPYVVAVHGYDLTSSMRSAVYRQEFAEAVSEGAAAVACASHHMARMAVLAGVPAAKSCVMRYPIDTSRIARDERIAKTEHPSFIHLGRLVEQKGPLVTLEAFALVAKSIPGATLTYIGEGDLRPELAGAAAGGDAQRAGAGRDAVPVDLLPAQRHGQRWFPRGLCDQPGRGGVHGGARGLDLAQRDPGTRP